MQLVGYNFEEDVVRAIEEYERDKNPSLNGMVEEFIKGILYEKKYLHTSLSEDEIFNPKELNKIEKFTKNRWGEGKVQVKFDDLNFGSYDEDIADKVIFKLTHLPDEVFVKYSKNYCQDELGYTQKDYSDFMLLWLENDNVIPEHLSLVRRSEFPSTNSVEFSYKHVRVCALNKEKYSIEKIDEVELFLNRFSGFQLEKIIEERKNANMNSDKFILNLMENPNEFEVLIGSE